MTEVFLYLAWFFALLDTSFTYARLRSVPSAELNPLVRFLNRALGPLAASLLGVLALQGGLGYLFAQVAPSALHVMVGIGIYRSFGQVFSHYSGIEEEIVEMLKKLKEAEDYINKLKLGASSAISDVKKSL